MRILYVCTDAEIGGAERLLLTIARHKDQRDTVGLVVLMDRGALSEQLDQAFDEVTYLGIGSSSRNIFRMVGALERAIKQFGPDVISSHLFHADLVTLLSRTRVPRTSTLHTQALGRGDHPLTRLIARVVGIMSGRFAAVVPVSDSDMMRQFIRKYRYKNVVAPINNVAEFATSSRYDSSSRKLISMARNHPVKGHQILFEAARQFLAEEAEWTLECYGPGVTAEDDAMREIVSTASVADFMSEGRIRLMGPTSSPFEAIASGAALLITSIYGETFPIVGVEAAVAGVPVITTDVGSSSEFADDPKFVVPPGDSLALELAMRDFAALSDDERTELSRRARQRAETQYSPDVAVARYRDVFVSVSGAPSTP